MRHPSPIEALLNKANKFLEEDCGRHLNGNAFSRHSNEPYLPEGLLMNANDFQDRNGIAVRNGNAARISSSGLGSWASVS